MLRRGNRLRTREFARRKRRVFVLQMGAVGIALAALLGGSAYLLRIDQLTINNVAVEGAEVVSSDELVAAVQQQLSGSYFYLIPKSNIVFYPRKAIEASVLRSFSRLERAEISFKDLQTVTLNVQERAPEALWCGENRLGVGSTPLCYYLDPEGYVYAQAPTFSGVAYLRFYGPLEAEAGAAEPSGRSYLSPETFRALRAFLGELEKAGMEPAELAVADEVDYELYLRDGTKILFSQSEPLSRVLDNLLSVLAADEFKGRGELQLEYIDLRFGNKIYYKERVLPD